MPALTNLALAFAYGNSSMPFTSIPTSTSLFASNISSIPTINATMSIPNVASDISSILLTSLSTNTSISTPSLTRRAVNACIPPPPKVQLPPCPNAIARYVYAISYKDITVTETHTLATKYWDPSPAKPDPCPWAAAAGFADGMEANLVVIGTGFVGDVGGSFVTVTKTSATATATETGNESTSTATATATATDQNHDKRAPVPAPTPVATAAPTEANCDMYPEITWHGQIRTQIHTVMVTVAPDVIMQTGTVTVEGEW